MTKTISKLAFQGDVCFRRVEALPDKAALQPRVDGRIVVAHSETGHDHYLDAVGVEAFQEPDRPMVCYLRSAMPVEVKHARSWDTHAPLLLAPGIWEVRREREYTPAGFRRVED